MADDLDREINYIFRVQDNTASAATEATAASKEAATTAETATSKQKELQNNVDSTNNKLTTQQVKLALQVSAITGMQSAVSGMISGINGLNIVSEETEQTLMKVASGFQIVAGLANGIKSLQLMMELLNVATLKNALLNTYNAVVQNPMALGLVAAGAGAAVSAAIILGASSSSSTSTTTNNVNVTDTGNTSKTTVDNLVYILGGA